MRELKFRGWDKVTKRYYAVSGLEYGDDGRLCEIYLAGIRIDESDPCANVRMSSDVIIEQYTGLKDKNGKEIYEGYIVRLYEHNWWDGKIVKHHKKPRIEGNFVVFYNDDTAAFEMKNTQPYDNGIRGEEPFGLVSQEYEVIGNIHENPELVKEDE